MTSPILTGIHDALVGFGDLVGRGINRLKDDAIIADRITPISQQALDFYAGITRGDSAGTFDAGGQTDIPLLRPTDGTEVTHTELLQKFGLRDVLAQRLLDTTKDLLAMPDLDSPSRLAFAVRGAVQDIYFGDLIGPSAQFLHGGYLGRFREQIQSDEPDTVQLKRLAYWIGSDLTTEKDQDIAQAKVRLTQLALAEIGDYDTQRKAVGMISDAMKEQSLLPGQRSYINGAQFDTAMSQTAQVAVRRMKTHPDLFDPVNNRYRVMESRPRTDADKFTEDLSAQLSSARTDLARSKSLFYGRLSRDTQSTVAIKVDANMGVDLSPTVTQGELVYSFLTDSFKRADVYGKDILHRIVESNGAENFYIGRETPDTLRDIGVFHYAMKAGLERASSEATADSPERSEADRLLSNIKSAQDAGVFYGSSAHRISMGRLPNEKMRDWVGRFKQTVIAPAELAARKYVRMTDPDNDPLEEGGGFRKKDFAPGVLELATYGGGELQVMNAWEDADARVLLTRGCTPHVIPGLTGPGKCMIGLVLTGTRPADTTVNRGGFSIVDLFPAIATSTGLGSIMGRGGFADIIKDVLAGDGRPEVKRDCDAFKAAWAKLESRADALEFFQGKVAEIHEYLRNETQGKTEAERFAYMRKAVKDALMDADDVNPGFFDDYWEAARQGTRMAERATAVVGGLIPDENRGAGIGPQIGLMQMTLEQPDEVWTLQEVKVDMDPSNKGRSGPDAFPEDKIVEVPGGPALIGGTDPRVVGMWLSQTLGYPASANHALNGAFPFDRRNNGISSMPLHAKLIQEIAPRPQPQ
jgi:hypothetical protein